VTQVLEGVVDVADSTLNKTVAVTSGQSYLAQPARKPAGAFKPPAGPATQTAATVRARGLVWAGRTFLTRAALERWLLARGVTWQRFARAHPALAAALASRRT
jgi:hypothetical protein